jgi:hypothetical protein
MPYSEGLPRVANGSSTKFSVSCGSAGPLSVRVSARAGWPLTVASAAVNYIPISEAKLGPLSEKLQARLNEGITNVTARIQSAIGQTPPPSSQ